MQLKQGDGIIITPEFPEFPLPHSSDTRLSCVFLEWVFMLPLGPPGSSPPLSFGCSDSSCSSFRKLSCWWQSSSLILSSTSGSSSCLCNSPEKRFSFRCSSLWWTMSSSCCCFKRLSFRASYLFFIFDLPRAAISVDSFWEHPNMIW